MEHGSRSSCTCSGSGSSCGSSGSRTRPMVFMSLILKPMPDIYRNYAQQLGGKRVNIGAVERRGHEHGVRKTAAGLLIRSRQLFKKIAQPRLMRVERLRDGCGDTIQLLRQLQALILLLRASSGRIFGLHAHSLLYMLFHLYNSIKDRRFPQKGRGLSITRTFTRSLLCGYCSIRPRNLSTLRFGKNLYILLESAA